MQGTASDFTFSQTVLSISGLLKIPSLHLNNLILLGKNWIFHGPVDVEGRRDVKRLAETRGRTWSTCVNCVVRFRDSVKFKRV